MATPGDITKTNKEPCYLASGTAIVGLAEPGDTVVSITSDWTDRTFQQTGSYIPEKYFNGAQCTVTTTISEILHTNSTTINPNWIKAFPWGTIMEDGVPAYQRFAFSGGATEPATGVHIGAKGTALAGQWRIIPAASGSAPLTETDRDFIVHKGLVTSVDGISFGNEAQVLSITIEALYDPEATLGAQFVSYGRLTEDSGTWADA